MKSRKINWFLYIMTASDLCISRTKWLTECTWHGCLEHTYLEFMKTVTMKDNICLVHASHKVEGSTAVHTASLNSLQSIHLVIQFDIKSTLYFKIHCHSSYSVYQHIHNSHHNQYLLWLQLWHLHVEYSTVTPSVLRQYDIGTKYICSKSRWPCPPSWRITPCYLL
jgi:hypothetical protein